jgi:hypothetical protein
MWPAAASVEGIRTSLSLDKCATDPFNQDNFTFVQQGTNACAATGFQPNNSFSVACRPDHSVEMGVCGFPVQATLSESRCSAFPEPQLVPLWLYHELGSFVVYQSYCRTLVRLWLAIRIVHDECALASFSTGIRF